MENMKKCEVCGKEKEVVNVEGHILCKECGEEIVRCDYCNRLLGVNFDELETNNFGKLIVPELTLPDKQAHLVFCNLDCLCEYLKKYRREIKDCDIDCGC